ncbi:ATP-binding protein [Microbacterium sp. DT81.1]|uniref:ATP-binding protein n=1 Tax=Microbacterium sp. DT81.1 TaxID=3393413 RepID=UPI003CF8F2A6
MQSTAPTLELDDWSDATPVDVIRQWRGESIQLVDWGNMSGHVQLDLDGESALMTGESGSGKSTIFDAVLAIMQPSRTRFNFASNSTGTGRARSGDQRDELSYLIGKLDDIERADGEHVPQALRPVTETSRWGALAMTFRSNLDERYTLVRAYYVPRAASNRNDLKQRCATIDGPFDLRQLHDAAASQFEMRAMRSLGLHPYEGPGPFHDAMCQKLGFGPDGGNVVDLLRRIQSGADVTSVDHLFSSTVLEEPKTFELAKDIADSFEGLRATYNEMKTVGEIVQVLSGIPDQKAELDAATAALADLDSLRLAEDGATPFAAWRATTEQSRREQALRAATDALPQADTEVLKADDVKVKAARQVRDLERALDDENTGLSALRDKVEDARADRDRIAGNRSRFENLAEALGAVVATADEHAALLALGSALDEGITTQRQRLKDRTVELGERRGELRRQDADLGREIGSLEGRSGRLPEYLDTARNSIADRLGWKRTDLPFIAELMDVPDEHAEWRTAAEAVFGSVGTRLVVPADQRRLFQRTVNDMRLGPRINFDFATTEGLRENVDEHDPRRLISRLIFAPDTPFGAWLVGRVNRAGGRHLCVDNVEELAITDGESRVVRSGQVSERTAGAHGGGRSRVLGYSNEDLLAEKRQQRADVTKQADQVELDLREIDTQSKALDQSRQNVLALGGFPEWSALDIDAAVARYETACAQLDAVRASSDRIRVLEKQLNAAKDAEEAAGRAKYDAEVDVRRLKGEITLQRERLLSLVWILGKLERGEVILTDAQRACCDAAAAQVGLTESTERLDETFSLVHGNLLEQIAPLQGRERRAMIALTNTFATYRSRWGDEANDSTDVGAYDEYLQILQTQQARGLEAVRNDWCENTLRWSADDLLTLRMAFKGAREEIKERIANISDLLKTVPFGAADDRLQLQVKDRIPPDVLSWLRDLQELSNNLTGLDAIEDPDNRFGAIEERFARIDALIDKTRLKPRNTSEDTTRNAILDVRRQVYITAHRVSGTTGEIIATHSSFAAKSGGETQELTAFITGAALRFRLGATNGAQTTYTPVFLDEGFIKADGKFTCRAVKAWEALGFQLIVAAPVEKFSAMEQHLQRLFVVSKDSKGRGFCDQLSADEVRAKLGLDE